VMFNWACIFWGSEHWLSKGPAESVVSTVAVWVGRSTGVDRIKKAFLSLGSQPTYYRPLTYTGPPYHSYTHKHKHTHKNIRWCSIIVTHRQFVVTFHHYNSTSEVQPFLYRLEFHGTESSFRCVLRLDDNSVVYLCSIKKINDATSYYNSIYYSLLQWSTV
jgi:hypothetical protein